MSRTLTDDQILNFVREAVVEVAPARTEALETLSLDVNIRDLAMDSVETMEMIGVIEEELGVIFADDELAQVVKFSDLAAVMRRAVS